MTVWDALVDQPTVVAALSVAARAAAHVADGPSEASQAGMTHSWLFTGPAGSGRSTAARAFAAALLCEREPVGCGECGGCRTALAGTAADMQVVRPEGLSMGVAEIRALVREAATAPTSRRWRVLLLTDADRLTEPAANALLKALEEPADRGVFLLCAPSTQDVLPTVRSRCRVVPLRLPSAASVADVLAAEGIDPRVAAFSARAAQGHIGRARRLATDEAARARRADVLRLPTRLHSVGDCLAAAADLVDATTREAEEARAARDEQETDALRTALGAGGTADAGRGRGRAVAVRGTTGALKDLERTQRSRGRRRQLDALDWALVDLAGSYRDVLVLQLAAPVDLVHPDQRGQAQRLAAASSPEQTLRRVEAVVSCREALVETPGLAPLLAVESLALALRAG